MIREMRATICGRWPVTRGSTVGRSTCTASYASSKARVIRADSAHHGSSLWAASWMILSSTSVTLRTKVTCSPRAISQRCSTSRATALRRWPTCGAAWTVGPQTYTPTWPARSGSNGRTARVRVSYRRRLTGPGYGPARTDRPSATARPRGSARGDLDDGGPPVGQDAAAVAAAAGARHLELRQRAGLADVLVGDPDVAADDGRRSVV